MSANKINPFNVSQFVNCVNISYLTQVGSHFDVWQQENRRQQVGAYNRSGAARVNDVKIPLFPLLLTQRELLYVRSTTYI